MKVLRDHYVNGKSNQNKEEDRQEKRKEKFSTREIEELMGVHEYVMSADVEH